MALNHSGWPCIPKKKLLVPDKVCLTQFFPLGDTILFAKWQEPYTYELNLKTGVERVVRDEIVQDVSEQYINYRNSEQKTNSYVNRASGARYVLPYILCEYLPDGGIAEMTQRSLELTGMAISSGHSPL